jgi:hypothetical protein
MIYAPFLSGVMVGAQPAKSSVYAPRMEGWVINVCAGQEYVEEEAGKGLASG